MDEEVLLGAAFFLYQTLQHVTRSVHVEPTRDGHGSSTTCRGPAVGEEMKYLLEQSSNRAIEQSINQSINQSSPDSCSVRPHVTIQCCVVFNIVLYSILYRMSTVI